MFSICSSNCRNCRNLPSSGKMLKLLYSVLSMWGEKFHTVPLYLKTETYQPGKNKGNLSTKINLQQEAYSHSDLGCWTICYDKEQISRWHLPLMIQLTKLYSKGLNNCKTEWKTITVWSIPTTGRLCERTPSLKSLGTHRKWGLTLSLTLLTAVIPVG